MKRSTSADISEWASSFESKNVNRLFIYVRGDGSMRLFVLLADEPRFSKNLYTAVENAVPRYTTVLNLDDEKNTASAAATSF